MKRQAIDDGGWFDLDAATQFDEDTTWNGSNRISVNTRSQWEHEALYLTAKGKWILNAWSQRQGTLQTWTKIEPAAAVTWLIRNDCTVPEDLRHLADGSEL
jgi:hypothetical protein